MPVGARWWRRLPTFRFAGITRSLRARIDLDQDLLGSIGQVPAFLLIFGTGNNEAGSTVGALARPAGQARRSVQAMSIGAKKDDDIFTEFAIGCCALGRLNFCTSR